jgi:putative FmdB family regulatory protein
VPTYQYACTECDHAFEQFQSFTDDALTECPRCSGRLRKLFNAVGVVFKGSGFYRNDSRPTEKSDTSEKSDKSNKSDKKPAETSSGSSEKQSGKLSEPSTAAAAGAS